MPASDPSIDTLLAQALPEQHVWTGRPTAETLKPLPGAPAIYLLVDEHDTPIQLATTQSMRRLLTNRLTDPNREETGKVDIAAVARGVRYRTIAAPFEGRWWYYRLARALYPKEYRELMAFGPASFLHVDWSRRVPEFRVSDRVWDDDGEFLGPFPTHKACQRALETLWDLFDLCRYPEQVRKAPHGTPCAYAEMGRCDAPCDGSVSMDVYTERCRAAWAFATGGVTPWIADADARMKQAAAEQRFEHAALLKTQIAAAQKWQTDWAGQIGPADRMQLALLVPVTRRKAWKAFLFRQGHLDDGPIIPQRKLADAGATWIGETLGQPPAPLAAQVRMEQTWLVCHFLARRESAAAIVVSLDTTPIEAVPEAIAGRLEQLNQKPPPADGTDDSADVS